MPDPERKLDAWARRVLNPCGPSRTLPMLVAMTEAIKANVIMPRCLFQKILSAIAALRRLPPAQC